MCATRTVRNASNQKSHSETLTCDVSRYCQRIYCREREAAQRGVPQAGLHQTRIAQ